MELLFLESASKFDTYGAELIVVKVVFFIKTNTFYFDNIEQLFFWKDQ